MDEKNVNTMKHSISTPKDLPHNQIASAPKHSGIIQGTEDYDVINGSLEKLGGFSASLTKENLGGEV